MDKHRLMHRRRLYLIALGFCCIGLAGIGFALGDVQFVNQTLSVGYWTVMMPISAGMILGGFLSGALTLRVAGYHFTPSRNRRFTERVLGALADGFPIPLAIGSLYAVSQLTTSSGDAGAFPMTAGIVLFVGIAFSALYYSHSKKHANRSRFDDVVRYQRGD